MGQNEVMLKPAQVRRPVQYLNSNLHMHEDVKSCIIFPNCLVELNRKKRA